MALPALHIRQPDIGRSIALAESIKSSRTQNRLAEAKLARHQQGQNLLSAALGGNRDRATYNALKAGGGPTPQAAATLEASPQAGGVDTDMMKRYLAYDPKGGKAVLDALGKMDENQRKQFADRAGKIAKLGLWIEQQPPENRQTAYQQALAQARNMGVPIEGAPPQYDPMFVQRQIMLGMGIDDAMKRMEPKSPIGNLAYDRTRGIISPEEYQTGIGIAKKPLVQMTTRQETEQAKAYGKEVGKFYGERFTNLQAGAESARTQNARLDRLDQLLDQTITGKGRTTLTEIKRAAETFVPDRFQDWVAELPGETAPAEAAMALANEMALELRNPAGGAGMPGAMSDKDREFLQSMVPGLGQTREGRKLLIEARKKVNRRSIDVARMARDYAKRTGRLDAGFEGELQRYAEANPLFTKEDLNLREKSRLPTVSSDADFEKLPSGTYFVDPEGNTRQKP